MLTEHFDSACTLKSISSVPCKNKKTIARWSLWISNGDLKVSLGAQADHRQHPRPGPQGERTRCTLARALACREADLVQEAIIELLRPHRKQCLTLTFDNGKEFALHGFIGKCLDADVYFARPYHSWERGTNENTNGLLRQFFPKGMSLKNLDSIEVDTALYRLNHRPRKCLAYRTPHEVFFNLPTRPLN